MKIECAREIIALMKQAGIQTKQMEEIIINKLAYTERQFRSVQGFMHTEIAASMKERDPEGSFNGVILKKCPYYYDLVDIFQLDESSTAPPASIAKVTQKRKYRPWITPNDNELAGLDDHREWRKKKMELQEKHFRK